MSRVGASTEATLQIGLLHGPSPEGSFSSPPETLTLRNQNILLISNKYKSLDKTTHHIILIITKYQIMEY